MLRRLSFWLFPLLFAACAPRQTTEQGVLYRSHNFPLVLQSGVAVAPVAHADAVEDAAEIAAFLSNELTTALMVGWEAGFVPPADVLNMITLQGEGGIARFREFREQRMNAKPLDEQDCTAMSRLIMHRYLLLTWVEEELAEGLTDGAGDYTDLGFAKDVARLHYYRVLGQLNGVIIDLWEAETLWEGRALYQTTDVYSGATHGHEELAAARDRGVVDFVRLLSGL